MNYSADPVNGNNVYQIPCYKPYDIQIFRDNDIFKLYVSKFGVDLLQIYDEKYKIIDIWDRNRYIDLNIYRHCFMINHKRSEILITNGYDNNINIFDLDGKYLRSIKMNVQCIRSLTVDVTGNVTVIVTEHSLKIYENEFFL